MKLRLKDRLEKARDLHLRSALRNLWDSKRSRSPVTFGNLDASYRRWEIATRRQATELIKIRREILFNLSNRLTIDASGSPVGFDSFVRIPNVAFGNGEWLRTTRGVHPIAR